MPYNARPRLRYFTRFKGDLGYLRACITAGQVRKHITSPIILNRQQAARLDTLGGLKEVKTLEDATKVNQIKRFTAAVWLTLTRISEGQHKTMPDLSEISTSQLANEIVSTYKGENVDAKIFLCRRKTGKAKEKKNFRKWFNAVGFTSDGRPVVQDDKLMMNFYISDTPVNYRIYYFITELQAFID